MDFFNVFQLVTLNNLRTENPIVDMIIASLVMFIITRFKNIGSPIEMWSFIKTFFTPRQKTSSVIISEYYQDGLCVSSWKNSRYNDFIWFLSSKHYKHSNIIILEENNKKCQYDIFYNFVWKNVNFKFIVEKKINDHGNKKVKISN